MYKWPERSRIKEHGSKIMCCAPQDNGGYHRHNEIREVIWTVKVDENLIVMGDRNSVVGKGRDGKMVHLDWGKGMKEKAAW